MEVNKQSGTSNIITGSTANVSTVNSSDNTIHNTQKLIRNVTFFGDSALPDDDADYKLAWETAKLLAKEGYGVVNGGGPGIMKAATDGAESVDGHTVAIYWQPKLAAYFEGKNLANITDEFQTQSNYLNRTFGLIEKGDAYIVCRGGTGTISELGMVWALAKLYYGCHKPVILLGNFWDDVIKSIQKSLIIDEIELGVLYRAATPEEVLSLLQEHEKKISHCRNRSINGDERAFLVGAQDNNPTGSNLATGSDKHDQSIASDKYQTGGETMQQIFSPDPAGLFNSNFESSNNVKEQQTSANLDMETDYSSVNAAEYHKTHAGELASQAQLDEFMKMVNPPAMVLDVGTGPGYDARYLSQKYSVTGIEPSKRFVEICRYESPKANVLHGDIRLFPVPEKTYKGIWARDSLHHIKKTERVAVFRKLAAALVEGGILCVIVREGTKEFVERVNKYQFDSTRFISEYTSEDFIDLAKETGLEIVKIDKTKRSHTWLIGIFQKKL